MRTRAPLIALGALAIAGLMTAGSAFADVAVTDASAWKAAQRAANQAKKAEKQARHSSSRIVALGGEAKPLATGSQQLIDAAGLQYFINTDITFSTTSSASGAMSEASYTGPVNATTSLGGTVSTTLSDAFDGYNALWFSQTLTGPAQTGSADYVGYNVNGAATLDSTCGGRQVNFPNQAILGLTVSRKVYVPATDTFARWETILTNSTGAAITVNVISANNLGSDGNTTIDTTSSGDATVTAADNWVSSFQNYGGTTSPDVRLAHVIWGPGGIGPNAINFANSDDNPFWSIPVTVPAGETRILLHFVTGQASKAAARAKAVQLAVSPLTATSVACMTDLEKSQVVNFASTAAGDAPIPALGKLGLLALVAAIAGAGLLAHRRLA